MALRGYSADLTCAIPGSWRIEHSERWLRRKSELLVVVTQEPEEAPHLRQCLGACPLDRIEGIPRLFRLGTEHAPAAARLDNDDRDGVGNDIVQLARDPPPLLGDRREGVLLLDALERVGALLECKLASASMHDHSPDRPGNAKEHPEEDDPADVDRFRVVHRHGNGDRHRHCSGDPELSAVGMSGGRVDGEQNEEAEELAVAALADDAARAPP